MITIYLLLISRAVRKRKLFFLILYILLHLFLIKSGYFYYINVCFLIYQLQLGGPGGRKKVKLEETMPSPSARRVAPTIGEDLKKRIQNATKSKENKVKKAAIKKEKLDIDLTDEKDEFDMLVESSNKKTLSEKLGTSPEQIIKKGRVKKEKKTDGLKQTKINFPKKETNGRGKSKKKKSDSEDENSEIDFSGSDSDFSKPTKSAKPTIASTRTARNTAKKINYSFESEDEKMSSDADDTMHDNDLVNGDNQENHKETMAISSSDEDIPVPKIEQSSEDLFDSLVGM